MHLTLGGRKTKIIATIGPASDTPAVLRKLFNEGIDAVRLNFSHGSHRDHAGRVRNVRALEKRYKKPIAIIGDLQGPKMRVGVLPKEGVLLRDGDVVVVDTAAREYRGGVIPFPSPVVARGIKKGYAVFLDDGSILLEVERVTRPRFFARVLRGGTLYSNKGVNVPKLHLRSTILDVKDRDDIAFAVRNGLDYLGVSFLRSAADIRHVRGLLGRAPVKLIAKIERPEALERIQEIVDAADAVMIARGDLGIETPLWELPVRQKEIVKLGRRAGKPVIVATQMLESMTRTIIPTRAEVSDVANAVYDLADAVMLSAETASGKHPVEAVRMMSRILAETERARPEVSVRNVERPTPVNRSVATSTAHIAQEIDARAILVGTASGLSARAVVRHRPKTPVVAVANQSVARSLAIVWGVVPLVVRGARTVEALYATAVRSLKRARALTAGDRVVFLSGKRLGEVGQTNNISVIVVR